MKRFWSLVIPAFAAAFALAFFSPGCGNPCNELAEVCSRCADVGYRESCEKAVAKGVGSVCSGVQPSFSVFCVAGGQGGGGGGESVPSGCTPAELKCVEQCINPLANATFCGSCNIQCATGELCAAGKCFAGDTCPATLPDKNEQGGCTNRKTDPTCCGPDCSRCGAQTVCVDGAASNGAPACVAPENCEKKVCLGACTSIFDDPLNCGKCGNACAPGELCSAGICAVTCSESLTQCCGKCVDITSNGNHCGGCDPECPEALVVPTQVCANGHQACDASSPFCSSCACANETKCTQNDQKTVCGVSCVDTQTDPAHCGNCMTACGPGEKCSAGTCLSGDCPAGQDDCNGGCVDLQADPANCGSCGNACDKSKSELCDVGLCATSCSSPRQACGGGCVDVSKDPNNCGNCATICAAGQLCSPGADGSGACVDNCPVGFTNCAGSCVDLTKDFSHCGACGNTCNDASVCTADSCEFGKTGGKCKNDSGAGLCGSTDPCHERKCDAKLGCITTPLAPGAIAAGCLNNPAIAKPAGWSSDDLKNTQQKCLWCDSKKETAVEACTFTDRLDAYGCTNDSCDQTRLNAPSATPDDANCKGAPEGEKCCATNLLAPSGCTKALSCGP